MATRLQRQRGFTIIELLVATTTGLLLTIGVMTIMYQSAGMADIMRGQIVMNQQAREMFRILTDGGMGTTMAVAGLRGRKEGEVPALASGYRMSLGDGVNTVLSSQFAPRQVACTAPGKPLSDCLASGESKSVIGYLAAPPTPTEPTPSANTPWVMVEVKLIDPDVAGSRLAGKDDAVDSFYAIIGLNKEIP